MMKPTALPPVPALPAASTTVPPPTGAAIATVPVAAHPPGALAQAASTDTAANVIPASLSCMVNPFPGSRTDDRSGDASTVEDPFEPVRCGLQGAPTQRGKHEESEHVRDDVQRELVDPVPARLQGGAER